MTADWWVGTILSVTLVSLSTALLALVLHYRRMWMQVMDAALELKDEQAAEPLAVLNAVIDLHRPQVMDRQHDSDVHSTITTVCGACSNVAGEPVPFPCSTIGTIRRERQRLRGTVKP